VIPNWEAGSVEGRPETRLPQPAAGKPDEASVTGEPHKKIGCRGMPFQQSGENGKGRSRCYRPYDALGDSLRREGPVPGSPVGCQLPGRKGVALQGPGDVAIDQLGSPECGVDTVAGQRVVKLRCVSH
jgi:hypothetical protein